MSNSCWRKLGFELTAQMDKSLVNVIAFDYDGTLRDSMNPNIPGTKPGAFAQAVIDFHPSLRGREEELKQFYFETSGMNRFRQLRLTEEKLSSSEKVSVDAESEWSKRFDFYVDERSFPLFPEAVEVTSQLKGRGHSLVIASSVPQTLLEQIMGYFPDLIQNFNKIIGNQKWSKDENKEPNLIKGIPYFAYICGLYHCRPENVAFVGDAPEDMKAGYDGGVFTIGKIDVRIPGRRDVLAQEKPDLLIEDLSELLELF